jgi:stage V sporulation protein S
LADATIRVRSGTPVAQLASAIANRIYEGHTVVLQMIGAAAISQAVKAIAVATRFTAARQITLSARPSIEDITTADGVTTRVLISVFPDTTPKLETWSPGVARSVTG